MQDKNAMHIDGTFVPLGPGKILVNPKRPCITGDHKSFFTYDGETKVSRFDAVRSVTRQSRSLSRPKFQ